jgi:hypothetical protein
MLLLLLLKAKLLLNKDGLRFLLLVDVHVVPVPVHSIPVGQHLTVRSPVIVLQQLVAVLTVKDLITEDGVGARRANISIPEPEPLQDKRTTTTTTVARITMSTRGALGALVGGGRHRHLLLLERRCRQWW